MVHYFMYKRIALSLCFTLFLGLLTSCSPEGILHLKKNESKAIRTTKTSENPKINKQKNNDISTPIALPPSFNDKPLKAGQINNTYMPNGMPALKPMKGVNADMLFSEKIKDTKKRFERVENAVVDLRKEFEIYKPAIVRLAAVESDIQNLIKELEVLLQETPNPQEPLDLNKQENEIDLQVSQIESQPNLHEAEGKDTKSSMEKPPAKAIPPPKIKEIEKANNNPKPQKPIPKKKVRNVDGKEKKRSVPKYDGMIAKNLRAGEHADKVRIVIDTNKRTDFSIDLDNDEKLIIIELPKAKWLGQKAKEFRSSKLLEALNVEEINNGNGSMVILSLKKDTKILQKKRLSPDNSTPYHRIYFDLEL